MRGGEESCCFSNALACAASSCVSNPGFLSCHCNPRTTWPFYASDRAISSAWRQRHSGFVRLPAPELLFSCVAKRKVTKEKATPRRRSPGFLPSESVSRGRAFRPDSCPVEKASPSLASPAARPLRPRLIASEGPREQQRAPSAQRQQLEQSKAERGHSEAKPRKTSPSVSRYGAVWPPRRSCRRESLHYPRHNTACNSGGLNQAISLGHLALGQQRKVARAPAGDRNRSVPCGTRPKARRRRAKLRNR